MIPYLRHGQGTFEANVMIFFSIISLRVGLKKPGHAASGPAANFLISCNSKGKEYIYYIIVYVYENGAGIA